MSGHDMKKYGLLLLLLAVSILPLFDLLHRGLPVTHDGQDHVARIANFYLSLSEGHIVPRWAGNLNWGYGHPILMFLYPLPSYMASLFHLVGFSFVDATKLVFAITYIASISAMYLWGRAQFGNIPGFIAALLYGFAPYRFVDLYVRGAIGEHVAFIWPPVIFWALLQLARNKRFAGVIISMTMAGLILSHNAISLMVLPLVILYGLYLYYFEVKDRLWFAVCSLWSLALGFLLSSFFWIPAFFEGKYTLRDIVTKGDIYDRFVDPVKFIMSFWSYGGGNEVSKFLGFLQWLVILACVVVFWRTKKKEIRWFTGGAFAVLFGSLFLMTSASEFIWQKVQLLQKFQFPWRLLTISVTATSVIGGIVARAVPKRLGFIVIVFVTVVSGLTTFRMWRAKEYIARPEQFYRDIYESTTDTGESSPIWSIRFMERKPLAPIEVIDGKAMFTTVRRSTTQHRYEVVASKKTRIVENTLYFPGWKIYVDGSEASVEFQDPQYRGLMTFWLEEGTHGVNVVFGETKLRQASNALSIIGIILLVGGIITAKRFKRT
ncbi:MAG: hypothetical protein UU42_C0010G0004 [Candidatus Woesebacteria bacterium GW2011_GWA1_41_13b]|uniref:Membrane protein 6-pyruvoyl-tetrahydropterin synthase-related domain-containing protein n=2 Tax=Microgenomates group TaxID=1794810 RepID=A0A0G0URV7_9BACT|nr:MAG: hypothetical protein UU42_C0010G0004 [Candidatus Woesebacteria bacterium GW2011_GWA1_41_13b]